MSDLFKKLENLAKDLELEAAAMRRDIATYPERCRAQRHHDVLCLVLKAWVSQSDRPTIAPRTYWGEMVDEATVIADLAYPPPLCSNCARVGCKGCSGERIEGPFTTPPKAVEGFSLNAGTIAKPEGGVVIARNSPQKAEEP